MGRDTRVDRALTLVEAAPLASIEDDGWPIDPARVQALQAAHRRGTPFPPLLVRRDGDGHFRLIKGAHRAAALRAQGEKTSPLLVWGIKPEQAAHARGQFSQSHAPRLRRQRIVWLLTAHQEDAQTDHLLERRLDETGRARIAPRAEAAPRDPLWRALAFLDHAMFALPGPVRVSVRADVDERADPTQLWAQRWAQSCARPVYLLREAVCLALVERLGLATGQRALDQRYTALELLKVLDRATRDAVIERLARETPLPAEVYLSEALEELGVDGSRETNYVVRERMPRRSGVEALALIGAHPLADLAAANKAREAERMAAWRREHPNVPSAFARWVNENVVR
jgi:hypothetical protein